MDRIVEHTDGNVYMVETTPSNRRHADITQLSPRWARGSISDFLREQTGQEQYYYDRLILSDADTIKLVLELGYKFSRSKAWRNLYDWAYFKNRNETG